MATSYLVRAARHARMEAELFAENGDAAAADILWEEIRQAEFLLQSATARMRQALRTRSFSGHGESHDRLQDSVDRLTLARERFRDDDDADVDELPVVDGHDAALSDSEWEEFTKAHPVALTREERMGEWERKQKERAREKEQGDALLVSLKLTTPAVARAFKAAAKASPDGKTRARDVAIVIVPALADKATVGRQRVIARVGQALLELRDAGKAVQIHPPNGKYGPIGTCRWALPGTKHLPYTTTS